MVNPFIWLVLQVLSIYGMIVFVWLIMSMLISFGILNRWHKIVSVIFDVLEKLVEPILTPIRRYVPTIGGLDLSPLVLILFIQFTDRMIYYYL
jgi:YggT family protein